MAGEGGVHVHRGAGADRYGQDGWPQPAGGLAQSLDILGGQTDAERELDEMRGPKVADRAEDDPRLQLKPVAADPGTTWRPQPGRHFEAMIRMMGGGGQAAMPGIEQGDAVSSSTVAEGRGDAQRTFSGTPYWEVIY